MRVTVYWLAQSWLVITSPIQFTVTLPPQLSLAMVVVVSGSGTSAAHETITLPGHDIVGGVPSKTVMVWAQVAVFPHRSAAVYVLVMVYLLVQVWLEMTSAATVTVTVPPQLSLEVTLPVLAAGTFPVQDTVKSAGQVRDGGVPSKTSMTCMQVAVLPQASVTL